MRQGEIANNSARQGLAFVAEASQNIGTGHVVETLNLVTEASTRGMRPVIWASAETPAKLIGQGTCPVRLAANFEDVHLREIAEGIRALGIEGVVTNFRSVRNEQVVVLKQYGLRVLCIDHWGDRQLDCEVVVNPSPLERCHRYTSGAPAFQMHAGVEFLPLHSAFRSFRSEARRHEGPVRTIVMAMGGVDRSGATVQLVEAILGVRPDVTLHVAIGSGFAHRQALQVLLARRRANRVEMHESLPSLAGLLHRGDVGFTAGGDTLAELACVGTPALVGFEDPHEKEQGEAFERWGFGVCLGAGTSLDCAQLQEALVWFDDPTVRQRHCAAGKELVDGEGASRVLDIASAMLRADPAVSSGSSGK